MPEVAERVWSSQKSPIPRELPLFDLANVFLGKLHSSVLALFDLSQSSLYKNSALVKTIGGNSLTLLLPEVLTQVWGNKRLTKKFKKEELRNEMSLVCECKRGAGGGERLSLQSSNIFLGIQKSMCMCGAVGMHKKDPRRP